MCAAPCSWYSTIQHRRCERGVRGWQKQLLVKDIAQTLHWAKEKHAVRRLLSIPRGSPLLKKCGNHAAKIAAEKLQRKQGRMAAFRLLHRPVDGRVEVGGPIQAEGRCRRRCRQRQCRQRRCRQRHPVARQGRDDGGHVVGRRMRQEGIVCGRVGRSKLLRRRHRHGMTCAWEGLRVDCVQSRHCVWRDWYGLH